LFLNGCDVSGGGGGNTQQPDPVVVDFPIAYIERPIPRDEDNAIIGDDILDLTAFHPGARLVIKDRASVPASTRILTDSAFSSAVEPPQDGEPTVQQPSLYDVKDLSINAEGTHLIFSMRAPEIEDADEDEQPTWNIWEYNLETDTLRRVIASDTVAEAGHDIMPAYLADGRIVFSSNRQRRSRAVLLDENKPQFAALTEEGESEAFLLHVLDSDGSRIEQISFNQSHDLYPTLLDDGRILFLRWDNYVDSKDRLSLYTSYPNGSQTYLEYGFHSQNTGTGGTEGVFIRPRELSDKRIQVTLRPRVTTQLGGGIFAIDTTNFTDLSVPVYGSGVAGEAQSLMVNGTITTDGSPSLDGYFNSVYPIEDDTGRLLLSWSPCQLRGYKLGVFTNSEQQLIDETGQFVDRKGNPLSASATPVTVSDTEIGNYPCTERALMLGDVQPATPIYGLWLLDSLTQTQSPVVLAEQETMFTEAVVIQKRPLPNYIPEPQPGVDFDQQLADENVGVVHIHSVYDMDGVDITPNGIAAMADPLQTAVSERPARFIRILKAVSMADDDVVDFDPDAFGEAGGQMKDILGYVPVEPDGSAMFKVPADVAFTFSILDASGKRVAVDGSGDPGPRHEYWMALRAGEVRECNGCHADEDTTTPHGRFNAEPPSVNAGALAAAAFPNTLLRDDFGTPEVPPQPGETMASYYARLKGPRTPSVNIIDYNDWTEDGTRPREPQLNLNYADLRTAAPTECTLSWNSLCRIVINYPQHIQPLWDLPRVTTDASGTVISDYTCTSCHARQRDGVPMIPAGTPPRQLNLSAEMLNGENYYMASYVNLFDGVLQEELLVDEQGNPIQLQPETEPEQSDEIYQIEHLLIGAEQQYHALDSNNAIVPAPASTTDPSLTLIRDDSNNLIPFLAYSLDSSGSRIIDPTPSSDIQFVYRMVQLTINGIPQFQAITPEDRVEFAPADNTDPNLTLLTDENMALIPYQVFELNELGQVLVNIVNSGDRSPALLSSAGALRSASFFTVFEPGGSHEGYLNGAELKLIAEWLDIGGQYYNNQFDAP